jgi:small subunit ribosomal protein S13
MARIAGVDLPRDKRIDVGLTYIYGIGRSSAEAILSESQVTSDTRVGRKPDAGPRRGRHDSP